MEVNCLYGHFNGQILLFYHIISKLETHFKLINIFIFEDIHFFHIFLKGHSLGIITPRSVGDKTYIKMTIVRSL